MKKRWMKSVVETSKTTKPQLPFSRQVRFATRTAPKQTALRSA